jgi:pantoate--beta-alanine ligase
VASKILLKKFILVSSQSMNIVTNIKNWQIVRGQIKDKTIGFVPTMGHLHAGHLSLCQRSKRENDITVVSIFVNPTQFNQIRDFELYPRTESHDQSLLADIQVDYLLLPDADSLYPDQYEMKVTESNLSEELEGAFRPGHFDGMLTVVLKLLNLTQAHRAYFGEKDFQQLLLIKKMVQAFFIPTEVIACETERAEDGLALSSRNSRLTPEQRQKATQFAEWLQSDYDAHHIKKQLEQLGFKVDYIVDKWQRRLGAVWIDDIRLIDNRKR